MWIIGLFLLLLGMFIGGLSFVWFINSTGHPKVSNYFIWWLYIIICIISLILGVIFAIVKFSAYLKFLGVI